MRLFSDPGRIRRPGSVLLGICFAMVSAVAEPIVTSSVTANQDALQCAISGTNLPAIGSIRVTISYQPAKVVVNDALVSSSVPRTAIGAILDTVASTIEISIVAAGSIGIPDNAAFAVMQIPFVGETGDIHAIAVREVTLVDENGQSHQVDLRTGLGQPFIYRPGKGTNGAMPLDEFSKTWNLQGRVISGAGDRTRYAPTIRVGRYFSRKKVLLPELSGSEE
jgi:hypothetical protein